MRIRSSLLSLAALSVVSQLGAQVVINEVDADNPGTDDLEYVELFDGGSGNTSLDGLTLVFFNGNGDSVYRTVDLDGNTTGADGFFVVAGPNVAGEYGITVDLLLDADPGNETNLIQNGADAVALLQGAPGDFEGAVVDDIATGDIVDAVVYGTSDGDDFDLLDTLLQLDELQVDENANGNKDNESIQRVPDGGTPRITSTYVVKTPSPRALNDPDESLSLSSLANTFSEDAGLAATTGTVTRTGPTDSDVTVTLSLRNADGQVDGTELSVPPTVVIPSGSSSATFEIDALDDLWPDGPQTINISATGTGYTDADPLELTVNDDGADTFLIAMNEIYPTVGVDANGDGEVVVESLNSGGANPDEFIEFVNPGDAPLDISGWFITDLFVDERPGFTPMHTFPAGTVLDPGCAVVVFGGGVSPEGFNPAFGDARVQNASGGAALFLNSTDRISVKDAAGDEVLSVSYADQDGFDGSSHLISEGDQGSGYDFHFLSFPPEEISPGTMGDGTPFCEIANSLAVSASPTTVSEDAGVGAVTLTITRSPGTSGDLTVTIESSDASELDVPAQVTIPDGSASVQVAADVIDDFGPDGTQTVTVTVQSTGFTPGSVEVQVEDDGDTAPTTIVINEIDADQDGTDTREFVELYNPEATPASLDGLVLVLYNGNNDTEYNSIPLSGTIPANGFFVIGGPGVVPAPDLVPASFGESNNIQNGADAVALFAGAPAGDFGGTGAFDPPLDAVLLDAVVYGTNDSDALNLIDALTPGGAQVNEGSTNNSDSSSRSPDGSDNFVALPPTPGASNGSAPAGFDGWASLNGIPGADILDDSDFDGIPAIVEYALGLDPTADDASGLPSPVSAGGDVTITYTKGAEAAADPNLTYAIEVSDDLVNWQALAADTNNATEISATLPAATTGRYVRLVVSNGGAP